MTEIRILGLFCGGLLFCVAGDISILWALGFGLGLFLLYGRKKGFSWRALGGLAVSGMAAVKNILVIFVLVGMLTAIWRSAGTIPVIVCCASRLLRPSVFPLMAFLLCSLVSLLTGTSFGTAATMGVICMAVGNAMGMNPVLAGGAVLSGIYVGDRCSPVSSSALLVSAVTGTEIYGNIRNMLRSGALPFLLACLVYGVLGLFQTGSASGPDLEALFGAEFRLHWAALLPALVILVLALLRFPVKLAMSASILTAIPLYLLLQKGSLNALPGLLVLGYQGQTPRLAAMLDGGGIVSMVKVGAIVCLSASYSGLFRETGLLAPAQKYIRRFARRTGPYAAMLVTALATSMIACNQSLPVMMSHQLCEGTQPDPVREALSIEDTVIVIAPLIPWSIAGAMPLQTIGAPLGSLAFACFLYLLPLCRLLGEMGEKRKRLHTKSRPSLN